MAAVLEPFPTTTATLSRALCIGIQYKGDTNLGEVPAAHNDAWKVGEVLKAKFGYEVRYLLDDGKETPPTRANIWIGLMALVAGTKGGDKLFVHYSGHGGQLKDETGKEEDGYDELIVPTDYELEVNAQTPQTYIESSQIQMPWKTGTIILDNDLYAFFTKHVPSDCHLTGLFDCCNSGTMFDLEYNRSLKPTPSPSGDLDDANSFTFCDSPTQGNSPAQDSFPHFKEKYAVHPTPRRPSIPKRLVSGISNLISSVCQCRMPVSVAHVKKIYKNRCKSMIIRGATKDPVDVGVEGPCINLWAACEDGSIAWGKRSHGLLVETFLECLAEPGDLTNLTLREFISTMDHLLRLKAQQVLEKNPDAKLQRLQFSSFKKPVFEAFMVI